MLIGITSRRCTSPTAFHHLPIIKIPHSEDRLDPLSLLDQARRGLVDGSRRAAALRRSATVGLTHHHGIWSPAPPHQSLASSAVRSGAKGLD